MLKDLLLALSFHQLTIRDLRPPRAPHDILKQPSLIQPHPLLGRQKPHTPVEDIVAGPVDQRRTHLLPWNQQEVDSPPGLSLGRGKAGGTMPLRTRQWVAGC